MPMTIDDLQLLIEFRNDVPAPDEATTRRIYLLATTPRPQITAAPVPAPRRLLRSAGRHRLIALSAAAAAAAVAVAAVVVGLTVSAATPQSAYAAAKKALAATSAADSGVMTMTVVQGATTWMLETTRWNGDDIALSPGQGLLGSNRQLLLVGGGAYVQQADGSWLHYANEADVGPALGPSVRITRDDVAGTTAEQILALATGLQKTVEPDGTTVYTGTIRNNDADPEAAPTHGAIMRMINNLRSGDEVHALAGHHFQLKMTVGSDGLVRQVSLTFEQKDTRWFAGDGTYTWSVTYSQLGSAPPITVPTTFTEATPGGRTDHREVHRSHAWGRADRDAGLPRAAGPSRGGVVVYSRRSRLYQPMRRR
jgi:hypothetical protein